MGYRGTTNCVLNFGEKDGAIGTLVGEPHKGLTYMFHMMNEARVGVGLGAVMLGYSGYLHSLAYARDRAQGRPVIAKDPTRPQIKLVEHPDVRRMLLAQKAYVEGGFALCMYAARLVDEERTADNDRARRGAHLLLEVLTPIVKAWPSQWCLEANNLAIQVHGGYGYTREYPVEQLYRDNRLNPIHEGTNGIQALDLLGRKVGMDDGMAIQRLAMEIDLTAREARNCESAELKHYGEELTNAFADVMEVVRNVLCATDKGHSEIALSNAHAFLELTGHVVVAVAQAGPDRGEARRRRDRHGQGFLSGQAARVHVFLPLGAAKDETLASAAGRDGSDLSRNAGRLVLGQGLREPRQLSGPGTPGKHRNESTGPVVRKREDKTCSSSNCSISPGRWRSSPAARADWVCRWRKPSRSRVPASPSRHARPTSWMRRRRICARWGPMC
jgi:hypothetical protein